MHAQPTAPDAARLVHPPRFPREANPVDVLDWVTRACPDAVLATALGPQSVAILELLHQMGRRLPVVFLDTHLHFPETYALRFRLQRRYRLTIQPVQSAQSLQDQAHSYPPWGSRLDSLRLP